MQILLHIGSPKTGTTALQDRLGLSARRLRAAGILYPAAPEHGRAHTILLAGLRRGEDLPRVLRGRHSEARLLRLRARFLATLAAEIARERPRKLILSSEAFFCPLGPEALHRLATDLAALGAERITVIAYLRRPSDYFLSSLQQKLKASSQVRQPRFPDYRAVIESFAADFPADLALRCFHRDCLAEGDIVADFLASCLADSGLQAGDLADPGRRNETLSAEAMDILRRFRAEFHAGREDLFTADTVALRKALVRIEARLSPPPPRLLPGVAEAVDYGPGATDALWLRDRRGVAFPGYDYARVARGELAPCWPAAPVDLAELVAIDPAVRAAMIEALAADPWAQETALMRLSQGRAALGQNRRAWLHGLNAG